MLLAFYKRAGGWGVWIDAGGSSGRPIGHAALFVLCRVCVDCFVAALLAMTGFAALLAMTGFAALLAMTGFAIVHFGASFRKCKCISRLLLTKYTNNIIMSIYGIKFIFWNFYWAVAECGKGGRYA
jgi:hypothetical protein